MFPLIGRGVRECCAVQANRVLQPRAQGAVGQRANVVALFGPFDVLRSRLLGWVGPRAAELFRDRARRVAWVGMLSVALSLVVTTVAPLWSLALSPVLLGVPHLLSDVRYLVVRPGLHRKRGLLVVVAAPLLLTSLGFGPAFGLLAMLPMIFSVNRASAPRRAALIGVWLCLTAVAWRFEIGFQLIFLHLHNALAVLIWWLWRPRTDRRAWWVPASVLLGVAAILSGLTDPVVTLCRGWVAPGSGTGFREFVETTTPLTNDTMAIRLVLAFAFLQSVHYVIWLRLIPEDDRPRVAPRSFGASAQALFSELGLPAVVLISGLGLGIAVWGLINLSEARLGYLHLAAFHGYLELAVVTRWLAQSSR